MNTYFVYTSAGFGISYAEDYKKAVALWGWADCICIPFSLSEEQLRIIHGLHWCGVRFQPVTQTVTDYVITVRVKDGYTVENTLLNLPHVIDYRIDKITNKEVPADNPALGEKECT